MVVNKVFEQNDVVVHQYRAALIEEQMPIDTARLACHPFNSCIWVRADRCERLQNVSILCE